MIIGTAGHIDHGKTALVKALTGVDADRLPEEKRRGITIDLGFAPLSLEGVGTVGVIDVPGHEDFVRSMLVGASGIDLGLLVVAADEGVMPQTREHLLILELLRIPQIASRSRNAISLTTSGSDSCEAMSLPCSTNLLPTPPIVSCSSRTLAGLDDLRAVLSERLKKANPRGSDDLFRMPVDRAFTIKGTGTVVTGTVWSGELPVDAGVIVLPSGKTARVRRIEQHGKSADVARAGGRAAIALAGLDVSDVSRGSVLVRDEHWQPTSLFEAVVTLEPEMGAKLTARTRLRLHAGASEVGARLMSAAESTSAGAAALMRVTTDAPLVLRPICPPASRTASDNRRRRRDRPLRASPAVAAPVGRGAGKSLLQPSRSASLHVGRGVRSWRPGPRWRWPASFTYSPVKIATPLKFLLSAVLFTALVAFVLVSAE